MSDEENSVDASEAERQAAIKILEDMKAKMTEPPQSIMEQYALDPANEAAQRQRQEKLASHPEVPLEEDPGYAAQKQAELEKWVTAQRQRAGLGPMSQPDHNASSGGYQRGYQQGREQGRQEAAHKHHQRGHAEGYERATKEFRRLEIERNMRHAVVSQLVAELDGALADDVVAYADVLVRYIERGEMPAGVAEQRFEQGMPLADGEEPGERRPRDETSEWFWAGGGSGWVVAAKVIPGTKPELA